MTYTQFIEELCHFTAEGEAFLQNGATHETPEFREWRHQTRSTIDHVEELGYRLPGKFGGYREYQATWMYATNADHAEEFARDLRDSLAELRYLANHFEKFGEPNAPTKACRRG